MTPFPNQLAEPGCEQAGWHRSSVPFAFGVPANESWDCRLRTAKAPLLLGPLKAEDAKRPSCSWDNALKFFCYSAMPQNL